jgi:hypothetical protein
VSRFSRFQSHSEILIQYVLSTSGMQRVPGRTLQIAIRGCEALLLLLGSRMPLGIFLHAEPSCAWTSIFETLPSDFLGFTMIPGP